LKKIVQSIDNLMNENTEYKLIALFSGTILKGFIDIFEGSFPPTIKFDVPLLKFDDLYKIIKSLDDDYFNKLLNTIKFQNILTYIGGHPRSI
jgi:hypothetical protein